MQAAQHDGSITKVRVDGSDIVVKPGCSFFATSSSSSSNFSAAARSAVADICRPVCIVAPAGNLPAPEQQPAEVQAAVEGSAAEDHDCGLSTAIDLFADSASAASFTEQLSSHFEEQGACESVRQLAPALCSASLKACAAAQQHPDAGGISGQQPSTHDVESILKVCNATNMPLKYSASMTLTCP